MKLLLLLLLPIAACAGLPKPGEPGAPADARYCGEPVRDAQGRIKRPAEPVTRFRQAWACPSTGQHTGSCPGWQVDHVVPLASGGCHLPFNLQWLPVEIKVCRPGLPMAKDCFERRVYRVQP